MCTPFGDFAMRRLIVENVLGCIFLYSSVVDCGKMIEAMQGCVGTFDECVVPILNAEEAQACKLRSDENAEYVEWASRCGPRGDPLTAMVVIPSAASLAMTVAFTLMFVMRTVKRVRVRVAPPLKWNRLSDLHLKAIMRGFGLDDTGTKKELVDRVSQAVRRVDTKGATPQIQNNAPAVDDDVAAHTGRHQPTGNDHGHLEDKSRLAIAHEELEKLKLQDTAFETLVFILAIMMFAFKIQPMLMQKEGVGCGAQPLRVADLRFIFLALEGLSLVLAVLTPCVT